MPDGCVAAGWLPLALKMRRAASATETAAFIARGLWSGPAADGDHGSPAPIAGPVATSAPMAPLRSLRTGPPEHDRRAGRNCTPRAAVAVKAFERELPSLAHEVVAILADAQPSQNVVWAP